VAAFVSRFSKALKARADDRTDSGSEDASTNKSKRKKK